MAVIQLGVPLYWTDHEPLIWQPSTKSDLGRPDSTLFWLDTQVSCPENPSVGPNLLSNERVS